MATKEQIDSSERYEVYIGNLREWKKVNSLELAIALVADHTAVSEPAIRAKVVDTGVAAITQNAVSRSLVFGADVYIVLDTEWGYSA